MTNETVNAIVDSHDELMRACRAMMALLLREKKMKKLDAYMADAEVAPGFAERAEAARKTVMYELVVHAC